VPPTGRYPNGTMRAYCDHAATTPLCDDAWRAMEPFLRERFGNPSEPHAEGRAARAGLDLARSQVAEALGVADDEVVFTGGGSGADNLAVLGRLAGAPGRVVTTQLEHPAVARSISAAAELAFARVGTDGVVDVDALDELVRPGDRLCAVIWASNVTGAIQPVRAIAELCAERGVPLHLDAVQAAAWLPLRLDELPGEITVAVAAHKLHGPKGVGVLAGRGVSTLVPVLHGGGQEHGLRPGTESVAQATGLAVSLTRRLADSEVAGATATMRDDYEAHLRALLPDVRIAAGGVARLPGHSLALISGLRSDTLCALLDEQGFAVAAGSACASGESEPSAALAAMGVPRSLALGALRATFGEHNRPDDGRRLAVAVSQLVPALRVASAAVGT
jgi:cysteine desulfurase